MVYEMQIDGRQTGLARRPLGLLLTAVLVLAPGLGLGPPDRPAQADATGAAPCKLLCPVRGLARQTDVAAETRTVAATWFVDWEATGNGSGTSWEDAFVDLQGALNVATEGEEIWVAAGTYYPSAEHGGTGPRYQSFQMLNGVGIYGGFDPSTGDIGWEDRDWATNETILSGDIGVPGSNSDNCYHVFYHPDTLALDSTAILDGFTIAKGYGDGSGAHSAGAGMHNDSCSPTLVNCTFRENSVMGGWDRGGAIYAVYSSLTLSRCTFVENSAGDDGGAMFSSSSWPTLTHCTFAGNSAVSGGAMADWASSTTIVNSTFSSNVANYGAAIQESGSSITLTNCTFHGNLAANSGGALSLFDSSTKLTNSILWGDSPNEISGGATASYSDVQNGFPGVHNISADPLFIDPENGDYHLQPCSPAIDAGDNDAADLPPTDFEGHDRVFNGIVDLGVDETDFYPPVSYGLTLGSMEGGSVTEPGEGTFDYGCGRIVHLAACSEGGYRFMSWIGDPVADPGSRSTTVRMDADRSVTASFVSGGVVYVDSDASGAGDGTSWEDAYPGLQAALDVASPANQVWVAAGTYYPSVEHGGRGDRFRSFQMQSGVGIYGGFDPTAGDIGWEDRDWVANETILSGAGAPSYHVFYHPQELALDGTSTLDGFTVTGGEAEGGGAHSQGGGMYNASCSPTLANCTFDSNHARNRGGGMLNSSASPTLTDCAFKSNGAGWYDYGSGGGMANENGSSPVLTNCAFAGNSADDCGGMSNSDSSPILSNCTFLANAAHYTWGGRGGGMCNFGSMPVLTNSLFRNNVAGYDDSAGGGMYNSSSSPVLTNCVFEGNSSESGGAMYNSSGSPVVTNCILWGDAPDEIEGGTPAVVYTDIEGGWPGGEGNINQDPLWIDPDSGDFHLSPDSPCVDTGTNDAPELPPDDFEGDDRIMDGDCNGTPVVDMGIDEVPEAITGLEAANDSPTTLGSTTILSATVSTGTEITYVWALGDGTLDGGQRIVYTYPAAGIYTAVVTATNAVSEIWAETVVTIRPASYPVYLPVVLRNP